MNMFGRGKVESESADGHPDGRGDGEQRHGGLFIRIPLVSALQILNGLQTAYQRQPSPHLRKAIRNLTHYCDQTGA